ncbi:MAG TPA: hypothetical protein VM933_00255 [Acidimicrobiales bacterium]|nr:hypothetical protein [Acidimicrobiales bacterium]
MRFCLFETGGASAIPTPRLGLLRGEQVVDVHLACQASMVDHMVPRRAREIARALCPPDLPGFLENGLHGWNALDDSLRRLGDRLGDPDLRTPDGEPVVRSVADVRVVPVVPWQLRYRDGLGQGGSWRSLSVPGTTSTLHTDGRAYVPEYLAVIGAPAEDLDPADAWAAVALVSETRPTDAVDAAVLCTPDELTGDEGLRATVTAAVSEASAHRTILVGDVVRTGLALAGDLAEVDLRDTGSEVGHVAPAH